MKIFRDVSFNRPDGVEKYKFDLFLSKDSSEELENSFFFQGFLPHDNESKRLTAYALNEFFRTDDGSYDLLDKKLKQVNKSRVAVLKAHGKFLDNKWVYRDSTKSCLVQSWIDKRDKEDYGALVVTCCNEKRIDPVVKKTTIFYAHGIVWFFGGYEVLFLEPNSKEAVRFKKDIWK